MVDIRPDDRFDNLTPNEIAIAGATSGFVTRALIQPFDVLKIRFQLQVEPISKDTRVKSKYYSVPQAIKLIYKEEGLKAFWKGHIPAQILSVSFGVIQFWSYDTLVKYAKTNDYYKHSFFVNFTCGAIAGTSATILTFPFDIMRTRLIAQSEKKKVYDGLWSGYMHMFRHEGLRSVYKGSTPTILSVAPNVGLQFMFYKFFRTLYKQVFPTEEDSLNILGSLVSGSLAGVTSKTLLYPLDLTRKRMQIQGFQKYRDSFGAKFVCNSMTDCLVKTFRNEGTHGTIGVSCVYPLDVVKTRLISQSQQNVVYQGSLRGLSHMFKHEGIQAFYKGFIPTVAMIGPNAGLQFTFFAVFQKFYMHIFDIKKYDYNVFGNLMCGSLAGGISKALLYPLDVIRKRMQIQGFEKYRKSFGKHFVCGGFVHCLNKVYTREGTRGLYKGFLPGLFKSVLSSAMYFGTFQTIIHYMVNK